MKYIDAQVMDSGGLSGIADNGNQLHLVSQPPGLTDGVANYADVATYTLGFVALNTGVGNGSYTLAAGVVSGRRLILAEQTVPGTALGVATHAVIIDTVNETVKAVEVAPNYNMAPGINQAIPESNVWEIEAPT